MLYYFRLFVLLVWGSLCSVLGLIISLARPFHPNNSYLFSRFFAPVAAKIMGLTIRVKNHQILFQNRPAIVVSNHQHNIDMILGCALIPPFAVSLGKKDIKFIPLFGQFYWLAGNILIDRFNRDKAQEAMDNVKSKILKSKILVWIMPEGTRNKTNKLKKFKRGAFITAIHCQIPIIPVAFSTFEGNINFNKLKSGTILAEVLPPIPTAGLTSEVARSLTFQVQKLVESKIESLDAQLKNTH